MDRMITMPLKHCSLGHEKQQVMDDSEVLLTDIISQLPDHVLVHILSLLTMKEAGRTSILSNRWRYLWTYYPNLTFDVSKTLSSLMYDELNEEEAENALAAAKHAYLNWVNQVVRSHRGPTIDQFMVQFGLNQDYSNQINEWVQFAFKMNVQRLTLDFFNYYHSFGPIRDGYCFPDTAVLHRNMLGISNSLTSLRLVNVNVTGEVLQWFLSTCLLLESMVVYGSTTLLNLEAHSTSLKSLEFVVCMKLTSVVVDAPNLVSFAHVGQKIGLQLSNSRKLTDMSLGGYFCNHVIQNPLEFYSHLSQLEALKLDIVAFEELILAPEFPLLARLKRLEVVVAPHHMSLLGFTSMIKASPMLYEVTFKLLIDGYCSSSEDYCSSSSSEESVEPAITKLQVDVPHNSLKVVNLVGFVGAAVDVELALNLIKNSVVLEKMILDTRSPGTTVLEFEDTEEREAARERAGHLATKLPPGVVSVII